ncbi:hypothetical protein [Microvirga pudoricolor]|uniref:hypothetical protein n=1 Tax=Microvirga pudoricolor TaxID=2778729 RepID=UPI00195279C1|nr:hypothetical protein [Microvirga pudoricolor]MBM6595432.1 hypothetical protein [Microvirga pudoricolor]
MSRYLKRKLEAEAAIASAQAALETAKRIAGEQLEKARADRRVEIAVLVEKAGGLELDDDLIQAAVALAASASESDRDRLVENFVANSPSRARSTRSSPAGSNKKARRPSNIDADLCKASGDLAYDEESSDEVDSTASSITTDDQGS